MANYNSPSLSVAPTWFGFPKPNPQAKLRLFCFPYAASGTNIFYKWPASLPADVELCLVHLPGRDHRLREKPFERLSQLAQALERPMLPYIDRAVAFFGHSMGGLISFELSRHLRRKYGLQPVQLFISGCGAPQRMQLSSSFPNPQPVQLCFERQRLDGLTEPMSKDAQLIQLMLSTLQADVALCATYSYTNDAPLDCRISVYGGLDDARVKYESLEAWRQETTGPFALHLFCGDHFFIRSAESLVLKGLAEELRHLADKVG
jgi:medium-chain acyl-[acyl-carrier-protein] hydrolase